MTTQESWNSADRIAQLLAEISSEYQPNEAVSRYIAQRTLVPIIGPTAVGKSTCMEAVAQNNPDFGVAGSFTTREQRPGEPDNTYRFLGHTRETLARILYAAKKRELVQLAVHPTTGFVYGSQTEDYSHDYTMLDTLASSIDNIRSLPFKSRVEIGMVASPRDWWRRIEKRRQKLGNEDTQKRIKEAKDSLTWLLDQGEEFPWVVNDDNHLDDAAKELVSIARGEQEPNPTNRKIGELLLASIIEA